MAWNPKGFRVFFTVKAKVTVAMNQPPGRGSRAASDATLAVFEQVSGLTQRLGDSVPPACVSRSTPTASDDGLTRRLTVAPRESRPVMFRPARGRLFTQMTLVGRGRWWLPWPRTRQTAWSQGRDVSPLPRVRIPACSPGLCSPDVEGPEESSPGLSHLGQVILAARAARSRVDRGGAAP